MSKLPFEETGPEAVNPGRVIIFSKPKTGKTTLCSKLESHLILDFENGAKFITGTKAKISTMDDLNRVLKKVKEAGCPYKYGIIDTITALEDFAMVKAERLYAATPQGKGWLLKDADDNLSSASGKAKYRKIIHLPQGAGYPWLRTAFDQILNVIEKHFETTILLGHLKVTQYDKGDDTVSSSHLDLTGKAKRTTTAYADAIGYLYRTSKGNVLSFKTGDDDIECGSRIEHLKDQDILISEIDEAGEYVTHWDKVFK